MSTKNVYSEIETADRYDCARKLPSQTLTQWLEALKASLPHGAIRKVLDLGCGTGRFTTGLSKAFECPVIGVEPSSAMLSIAMSQDAPNVEWKQGEAEQIPLQDESIDLVFMSQVFHHLVKPAQALREINRVLTPKGCLAIRNGTREHNKDLAWLKFFPGAREIEDARTPSQEELKTSVCAGSFELKSEQTIRQLFAASNDEYFEKISQRGLSALILIGDEAFQIGLQRFQNWVKEQPRTEPVYEPVDLFVFRKK